MTEEVGKIAEALNAALNAHDLAALPVPTYSDIKGQIARTQWYSYKLGLEDALRIVQQQGE